jgi:carbonic anhydrase
MRFFSLSPMIAMLVLPLLASAARADQAAKGPTAGQAAIEALLKGNQRYVRGQPAACSKAGSAREAVSHAQKPSAVILTCMDSRVPPEIVFDQTVGDVFAVRVAGNVLDPMTAGSIEFVVQRFDTPLVVVLGHERCGAATALVGGSVKPEGDSGIILKALEPAWKAIKSKTTGRSPSEVIEMLTDENIGMVTAALAKRPFLAKRIKEGRLEIVGAKYDLDDGAVTLLSTKR